MRHDFIHFGLFIFMLFSSLQIATPSLAVVVFSEDFESLVLGDSQDEGLAGPVGDPSGVAGVGVWTDIGPAGWSIDRTSVPGYNEPAGNNGVKEWIGWNFANKDWWSATAGNQNRSQFTNASGIVMVADPDEWDDALHPNSSANGWYNTTIQTPAIPLGGLPAGLVNLSFDSSWRPEFDANYQQRVTITVSYDGAAPVEILNWESDNNSENFHDANTNESVSIGLQQPAGASSMVITFGMFDAGNDWWWAIDNVSVEAPAPLILRVDPVSGAMELRGNLDAANLTGYEISSLSGSLEPAGWQVGNLAAQNLDSIGDGPGDSWESLFATSNQLAETFLLGNSSFDSTRIESLGIGFLPSGTEDLVFEFSDTNNEISLGVVEYATIYQDADFDENGAVDGADLSTWQSGFGQFQGDATKVDGDATGNGYVDGTDFLQWQRELDLGTGSPASSVPEPSTWVLCGLALLGLTVIRGCPH